MDTNETDFSLEVHSEIFSEVYSTHEDQSFDQNNYPFEKENNPICEPMLEKEEIINKDSNHWHKMNHKQSDKSSNKNQTNENYIDQSQQNRTEIDNSETQNKRVKISPIKWLPSSPTQTKKKNIDKIESRKHSHHHHHHRHGRLLSQHRPKRSIKPKSRRRSSSFELHQHLKHIFNNCQYFLIKSNNHENVDLAKRLSVWSTPPGNEAKINQAFDKSGNVILIFSIKESGQFQGFARISSKSDHHHPPINWVLPVGLSQKTLAGVFKLDWISKQSLSFNQTLHILNRYNENQPIKIGRDGQEIDAKSGESLCRLFYLDEKVDVKVIANKSILALKERGLLKVDENLPRRQSSRNKPTSPPAYHHYKHAPSDHLIAIKDKLYPYTPPPPPPTRFIQYYKDPYEHQIYASEYATSQKYYDSYKYYDYEYQPKNGYAKKEITYEKKVYHKSTNYEPSSYDKVSCNKKISSANFTRDNYDLTYSSRRNLDSYMERQTYGSVEFRRTASYSKLKTGSAKARSDYYYKQSDDEIVMQPKDAHKLRDHEWVGLDGELRTNKLMKESLEKKKKQNKNSYYDEDDNEPISMKKKYSDHILQEVKKQKNTTITDYNHKRKKAPKRKSSSPGPELKKKQRIMTKSKNKIVDSENLLALMQDPNRYNNNRKKEDYQFDPRVPPPPPFPFFSSAYHFLPQPPSPPSSYSISPLKNKNSKKENRVKSANHVEKY